MAVFLAVNGYELVEQSETELAEIFERLGSRAIGQGEFFEWVLSRVRRAESDTA
jgi:prophage maintenance system killer protein